MNPEAPVQLVSYGERLLKVVASRRVINYLREKLAVTSANYHFVKKRFPHTNWDGKVHYLTEDGVCGVGLKSRVMKLLEHDGFKCDDKIDNSFQCAWDEHLVGRTLVPEQVVIAQKLMSVRTGCVEVDVSSGKSYIIMNMAACLLAANPGWKVAVLVPRKALLYQFFEDAQQVLPQYKVGILGDQHRQMAQVTIATAATAVASEKIKDQKIIADWLREVDAIITDEGHHATAATWEAIYRGSNATVMWALSAKFTFGKGKKELERALEATFGPPLYKGAVAEFRVPVKVLFYRFATWKGKAAAAHSKLIDGVSVAYKIDGAWHRGGIYRGLDADGVANVLCLDDTGVKDRKKFGIYVDDKKVEVEDCIYNTAHDRGIMEFKERDDWACDLADWCAQRKEIFLISVSRDRHGEKLMTRLKRYGLRVERLSGSTTGRDLNRIIEAWKNHEIDGVVAHKDSVSEGLSIPALTHFIKLDGSPDDMTLHQQKGRPARREGETKMCGYLHIPVDWQHPTLYRNSKHMADYYQRLGTPMALRHYETYAGFKNDLTSPTFLNT